MTDLEKVIESVPSIYRNQYRRALNGELSPRQTIKVKCLECCGWHRHQDGIDLIGDCRVLTCPLWAVRPYQNRKESRRASEAEGLDSELDSDE